MSKHYYEVTGETGVKIVAMNKARRKARNAMFRWAEQHGSKQIAVHESHGVSFYVVFDENPNPKAWKSDPRDRRYHTPRLGTKEGKALAVEMEAICKTSFSGARFGDVIGMKAFGAGEGGLAWRTPGVVTKGKRAFVVVPDDYMPPKAIAADMKRISDLEFEKLSKPSKKTATP